MEGAPHTAGRDQQINLCVLGCPLPPYIKEQGRRRPALGGARQGSRIPTPSRSRFPPFLVQLGEGGKEGGEKEGKGGPRPKTLVQFRLGLGGAHNTSWLLPLLPTKAH